MPQSGTGERVTEVLDFPSRDGLSVQAIRIDYEPGGFTRGTHRHPAGAYVYVIDGSVEFVVGDGKPIVLRAGESFYEPPNALHAVSRNASEDVPASLIAFFVLGDGDSELAVEEADRPRPGPGEALVRVHAAAITRDELQWPVDRLPAVPSYELAGVVEETGPGVAGVAPGDEVFALMPFDRDGVAADYTALPTELLAAKPRSLSRVESAAIPLPALTAWQGLFDHGRLATGERVLIHGAAGAVGGLAVQLARTRNTYVVGTAVAAELGPVRELGAQEAVDAATSFEDAMEPVDLVFDTVGGERLRRSRAVLRPGGRGVRPQPGAGPGRQGGLGRHMSAVPTSAK